MSKLRPSVNRYTRYICLALFLLAASAALMVKPIIADTSGYHVGGLAKLMAAMRSELGSVTTVHVLAFGMVLYLFNKVLFRSEKQFSVTAFILACVFSFFLVIGFSFSYFNSFAFILENKKQMIISSTVFLGYAVIIYSFLKIFFIKLDGMSFAKRNFSPLLNWIDAHFVPLSIVFLIVSWIASELAFFPGSMPYDGRRQLEMFLGYQKLTTHHPYFSTLLIGYLYKAGRFLLGQEYAVLLFVLAQNAAAVLVSTSVCSYIHKKTNIKFAILSVFFFSFVPVFFGYFQAVMKDGLYVIAFLWFTLVYIRIWSGDHSRKDWVSLILSGILTCLMRGNGIYIIIPALMVFILIVRERKSAVIACAAVILLYFCSQSYIKIKGITPGPKIEAFSIPVQQIARYVTFHEDRMTEDDIKVLNRVVVYKGIPERYDPEIADPIKDRYRSTTDEEWNAFWKLWMDKFKDDPMLYVEATMNHVFGYIDPVFFYTDLSAYPLYIRGAISEEDTSAIDYEYAFSDDMRRIAVSYIYMWNSIPGLSFLVNPAFYTWLGILLVAMAIRKKQWDKLPIYLAPFMNVLTCFASPVNGYMRYMLPVAAAMPLYLAVGFLPDMKRQMSEISVLNTGKI